ncbi:MAG: hypothetical protein LBU37_13400 [Tannerellaceae bacterium]|jgi:hypothetical protein|nr:hypothetical protein [Tannerellaceae bacterium]
MNINININMGDFDREANEATERLYQAAIFELHNIGENYITRAKESGNYQDQSASLRNAHSYRIYRDGVSVDGNIGELPNGKPNPTGTMFDRLKTGKGLEFIVGNGMEYASFVEGMGFNVTTSGFLLVEREIRERFG